MVKKIAVVAVLLFAWMPVASYALGLGPITMRSALNQPLNAEIEIHSVQPGDLDGLAVRLASNEDFARIGVDRLFFLSKINFKLAKRGDGSPFILLTTREPVTEPYLDFLIEARWARGRALKEYTVLVDPPVLMAETPAPVQQATAAPVFAPPAPVRSEPQAQSRPAPAPVASRPAAQRRAPAPQKSFTPVAPSADIGDGYRVKANETLSIIADKLRSGDVSTNQMMMALLKANPNAFYGNNINRLKAGVVLRMDDPALAQEMSRAEANAAVRTQMAEWREGRPSSRLVKQVASAEGSSRAGAGEGGAGEADVAAVDDDARLKLVAPGAEGAGSGATGEESAKASSVQQELILATEALDANRAETEELKARLADLEEQLSSMQRLINLKDEEMLALQTSLKEQQDQAVTEPAAEQAEQPAATEQQPAAAKEEKSGVEAIVETVMSDTTILAGIAVAVLLVLAWMIMSRRKRQEGFEESILNVGTSEVAEEVVDSSLAGDTSSMVSDFAMSGMDSMQSDAADVDPISEADVYLAYGRHQQAEDIIKQALDKDADRLELHAKLLEVMHAANNREGFEAQAQVLHDKLGGDESNEIWARAVSLGSQIAPANPLFGGSSEASEVSDDLASDVGDVTADDEDLLDFDFDDDEAFAVADVDSAVAESAEADKSDDDDLDFDVSSLDFDLDIEDETDSAIANIDSMDEEDNSLDFDLADDGDVEVAAEAAEESEELLSLDDDDSVDIDLDDLDLDTADVADETEVAEVDTGEVEAVVDETADFDVDLDLDVDIDTDDDDTVVALDTAGGDSESASSDDIFADVDEIGTKLDLAKAYVDMGDSDGARSILDEVMEEGDDTQKQQAEQLLQQMG